MRKDESENLLSPSNRDIGLVFGRSNEKSVKPSYNSFQPNGHFDNLNVTADSSNILEEGKNNNNATDLAKKTGKLDNNMHKLQEMAQFIPPKQHSFESYTEDSQLNTTDKSDDDILDFSDSVAISAFTSGKANIWHNSDNHGIISWQTDTSPSDNLENEESYFGSISVDQTPSEDNFPENNFAKQSEVSEYSDVHDSNIPNDNSLSTGSDYSSRIIPLDQIMNNLQRLQSSRDSSPTTPSPGASG